MDIEAPQHLSPSFYCLVMTLLTFSPILVPRSSLFRLYENDPSTNPDLYCNSGGIDDSAVLFLCNGINGTLLAKLLQFSTIEAHKVKPRGDAKI